MYEFGTKRVADSRLASGEVGRLGRVGIQIEEKFFCAVEACDQFPAILHPRELR